jgi:hypothetical protein
MRRTLRSAIMVLACVALLGSAGCGLGDPRTSNQGGGTLLTAGAKVAGGNIGTLTADEWQILLDNAPTFAPQFATQFNIDVSTINWPVLTDEQAQAVVDFLTANNITTFTQLQQRIEAGDLVVPDVLLQLFDSAVQGQVPA